MMPGTEPLVHSDDGSAEQWAALLDWRRRTGDLYARVRELLPADPVAAHTHWTAVRTDLLARHPQSPVPTERRGLLREVPVWPYDPRLAFTAPIEPTPEERLMVLSSTGAHMPLVRFGRVTLPVGRLDVYWIDVYGGGVFVPFRDATSGRTTYGGGRYLLDTVKGADLGSTPGGELRLDFNFAYHPSCHHDPRWSCPLAPPGNTLGVDVQAGERTV